MATARVAAIIVAYNTNARQIEASIRSLTGVFVIVVDNSTTDSARSAIRSVAQRRSCEHLSMNGNAGIATAQNAGMAIAWQRGFDFVLLLDDDSVPDPHMTRRLLRCYMTIFESTGRDTIVCATPIETDASVEHGESSADYRAVTDMMSSGTLIPRRVSATVGAMDDALFIDYVDFDWGWRAISLGFGIVIARDAYLHHRLGDGTVRLCGVRLRISSPIRHYFQFRNMVLMLTRRYVPWRWKLQRLTLSPTKLLLLLVVQPPRLTRIAYALRGILDGLRGVSGPYAS